MSRIIIIKIISHPPLASIFLMSSIKAAPFLLNFVTIQVGTEVSLIVFSG
jgi:hypothetical protein